MVPETVILARPGTEVACWTVTDPVGAVEVNDVHPPLAEAAHDAPRQLEGLVGGVVEHLDLEQVRRIVEAAGALDQSLGDEFFVDGAAFEGREVAVDRLPGLGQFRVHGG